MEKSFNIWRGPTSDDSQSDHGSEEDIAEDSTHKPPILAPDSDIDVSFKNFQASANEVANSFSIVESSDEDYAKSSLSLNTNGRKSSEPEQNIISKSFVNSSIRKDDSHRSLGGSSLCSPIYPPSTHKKNKKPHIIESDSDEEHAGSYVTDRSIPDKISDSGSANKSRNTVDRKSGINNSNSGESSTSNIRTSKEKPSSNRKNKKHYVIDSDSDEELSGNKSKQFEIESSSGEENSTISSIQTSSKIDDSELSDYKSFQSGSTCSSTDFSENDSVVKKPISDYKSKTNFKKLYNSSTRPQTKDNMSTIDLTMLQENNDHSSTRPQIKDNMSTIDLTMLQENNDHKNIVNKQHVKNDSNNVIVVDTGSESEGSSNVHLDLTGRLTSMKITPETDNKSMTTNLKQSSILSYSKINENDYFSRVESLKAEETKLKMQVSKLIQEIESTKATLRTANISALPDKGVRLQMFLKKQETQMRDLRYQQSTVGNEIVKLQMSSSSFPQPINVNRNQEIKQKIFKLPTTDTDVFAMGKKAMETHRTQQALTVDSLRILHNSLKNCPDENHFAEDPKGIRVELMPHQKHALAWLLWREKEKPSGGILADDMGLGKTLTLISLIMKSNEQREDGSVDNDDEDEENSENDSQWMSSKRSKALRGKTLVVCPASLLGQWEGEINSKVKRGLLDVVVHHGQQREGKARRLARPDVVITTYNIVNRDGGKPDESPLFQIRWERIILDEAHQIRNYKTLTAKAVFLLKSRSRWALTGTPVHNKEIDLYAIMKFLRCSPFDDLAVWKRWVDNRDAAGTQRLNTIIQSLMLRRTKQGLQEKGELKSLTSKKFHPIFVTMDKEEQDAYENLLNFSKTLFAQFLAQKAEKENALNGIPVTSNASKYLKNTENPFENHPNLARLHKQMTEISDVKGHHILLLLLRLRQFCCHPALIKSLLDKEDMATNGIEGDDGLDIDMMDRLTRMSIGPTTGDVELDVDSEVSVLSHDNSLYADDRLNSKLRKVMDFVDEIIKGEDKLIIVSQWVSLLDVVHVAIKARNIKCVVLTGKVPVKDRGAIVEKFNRKGRDPRIMLLSLTAGGVGLNLVGANHLLLLDLHWNPQLESQACDRIYRVGQEKNVQIYKFITSETIEERILKLQEVKLSLADSILNNKAGAHSSKLSLDDLKTLFQL